MRRFIIAYWVILYAYFRLLIFLKINFFKISFQEYHQSVEIRLDVMVIWVQIFC